MLILSMVNTNARKNRRTQTQNDSSKGRNSLFNILLMIGSILISIFFLINSVRSIRLTIEKLAILDQAEEDVQTLRLKNLSILEQSELVKTDFFVELQGRDKLHLSQNNEIVVIIPEELLNSNELNNYYDTFVSREDVIKKTVGLKSWLEFFEKGV